MLSAIEYLNKIGLENILEHEQMLARRAHDAIAHINGLRIFGPPPEDKAGIVSFVVDGISTQDIAIFMDRRGIALRAGHHCAMPLHERLGVPNSLRASFYIYNTTKDVDRFAEALHEVVEKLR